MKMMTSDKEAYRLIAKQLLEGLNEEEGRKLERWLAEPGHRELYLGMTEKEHVKERLEKWASVDVKKYANDFEREIGRQPARKIGKWWACTAAAVAVLCVVGAGIWLGKMKESESGRGADVAIVPGRAKAVLVMGDGQQVELDTREGSEIVEKNGKVIKNDSAWINYTRESGEREAGLINKIIVPTGGEYNLILSDGTTVYLNAESRIEFPVTFTGKERCVILEGEAYFQVMASEEHPFIVKTKDMDVLVTGTEFNVKAYSDETCVQTTLLKGKVTVFSGEEKKDRVEIKPGQQAQWNRTGIGLDVREVDPELFVAWRNGKFLFRQNRLENIMKTLARWYDVEVVYLDESIKDMVFAGKLDRSENITPILNVLRATDKLTVEVHGKRIVLGVK